MFSSESKDWKIIKDKSKGEYCFLIRINNWAIELKEKEFVSLYQLLKKIINQLYLIQDQLMNEEIITLELEKNPWFVELEGTKDTWSLRFIFDGGEGIRSFEMYWPIPIAKDLFFEMRKMWESMH